MAKGRHAHVPATSRSLPSSVLLALRLCDSALKIIRVHGRHPLNAPNAPNALSPQMLIMWSYIEAHFITTRPKEAQPCSHLASAATPKVATPSPCTPAPSVLRPPASVFRPPLSTRSLASSLPHFTSCTLELPHPFNSHPRVHFKLSNVHTSHTPAL